MDYIIGELYFFMTYTDNDHMCPKIYSATYIGKNLDDGDEEEIWYFQDAHTYNEIGPYPDFEKNDGDTDTDTDTDEVGIYTFRDLDLYHIKNPQTLSEELEECLSRRNQNNKR